MSVITQESATLKRPRSDDADTLDAGENEDEDEDEDDVDHVINEHKQLEQEEEKTTEEYERERATSRMLLKDLQTVNKMKKRKVEELKRQSTEIKSRNQKLQELLKR